MRTFDSYLDRARAGHREAALDGLVDLGEAAIPRLVEVYRAESDPSIRSILIEVIWQLRSPASIEILAEALMDPSPEVWRQALDGLVTLASPESLRVLEA